MSKPRMMLVARMPDGTEATVYTAAGYTWAGIARQDGGPWEMVARGWSNVSVRNRTLTKAGPRAEIDVVPLRERIPSLIWDYYPGRGQNPRIVSVFRPDAGWQNATGLNLGKVPVMSFLVRLQREGWTAVAVSSNGSPEADFPISQLLRRTRPAPLLTGSLIGSRTSPPR